MSRTRINSIKIIKFILNNSKAIKNVLRHQNEAKYSAATETLRLRHLLA